MGSGRERGSEIESGREGIRKGTRKRSRKGIWKKSRVRIMKGIRKSRS